MKISHATAAASASAGATRHDIAGIGQNLFGRLAVLDKAALRRRFLEQDEFIFIEDFSWENCGADMPL